MDYEFEAQQRMRKEEIEKLERDLKLTEAQQQAFEAEGLNTEKAKVLQDGIDETVEAANRAGKEALKQLLTEFPD